MQIFYNKDGWVCNRMPYNIPIQDENDFIEVGDGDYTQTLNVEFGKAWRVVNGKLEQQIYNQEDYSNWQKISEIKAIKEELQKAKEDVEQVTLFDMERNDYDIKKQRCVELIELLRELEK